MSIMGTTEGSEALMSSYLKSGSASTSTMVSSMTPFSEGPSRAQSVSVLPDTVVAARSRADFEEATRRERRQRNKVLTLAWIWGMLPGILVGVALTYTLWSVGTPINKCPRYRQHPRYPPRPRYRHRPRYRPRQSTRPTVTTTSTRPTTTTRSTVPTTLVPTPSAPRATFYPGGPRLTAEYLNVTLNWTISPCEDFYGFVCSRFHGPYTDVLSTVGQYIRSAIKAMLFTIRVPPRNQSALEKAAGLFQACVQLGYNATGSEAAALRSFLRPAELDISNMAPNPNFSSVEAMLRLSMEFGFPSLVCFGVLRRPYKTKKVLEVRGDFYYTWYD
ncbi:hypothetical protein MTO96_023177 [Rhipicephalus appendiculatus]